MARRGERDRGKERFWRRLVRQWRSSGQSVRGYCAQHGLSEPAFYAWRRTIAARDRQGGFLVSAAQENRRCLARPVGGGGRGLRLGKIRHDVRPLAENLPDPQPDVAVDRGPGAVKQAAIEKPRQQVRAGVGVGQRWEFSVGERRHRLHDRRLIPLRQ